MRRIALALCTGLLLASCQKREADALVVAKEHIAAAASPSPNESSPAPPSAEEVVIDGYVMKPGARGTGHDPRALKDPQWRVTVRTLDGRAFVVQAEQAQYEKLKEGDRVRVRYRTGKYTDIVWSSEIVR